MSDKKIRGRVWTIDDEKGRLIDNIDTDQIYHNEFLTVTEMDKMGQYAFGNLEEWEDFSEKASEGDILVVGKNFGAGSSRQQAVDCFISLGISLIIGASFGAIYWRNAINSGFPVLRCPEIVDSSLRSEDEIEVTLNTGKIKAIDEDKELPNAEPFSDVQMEIYEAGSLFKLAK